jgi:hypothetical protein
MTLPKEATPNRDATIAPSNGKKPPAENPSRPLKTMSIE